MGFIYWVILVIADSYRIYRFTVDNVVKNIFDQIKKALPV